LAINNKENYYERGKSVSDFWIFFVPKSLLRHKYDSYEHATSPGFILAIVELQEQRKVSKILIQRVAAFSKTKQIVVDLL